MWTKKLASNHGKKREAGFLSLNLSADLMHRLKMMVKLMIFVAVRLAIYLFKCLGLFKETLMTYITFQIC